MDLGRKWLTVFLFYAGRGQFDEEIVVGGVRLGTRELRYEVPLFEIELAKIGNALRLINNVRMIRKQRAHLFFRLDVALFAFEAESIGVVEILTGADRQQDVVSLGVLATEVMRVVRCYDRQAEVLGQLEHALGDDFFVIDRVVLHFKPEPVGPEVGCVPLGRFLRFFVVSVP